MAELSEVCRIVVIAASMLETKILEEIMALGAKGYNCSKCVGKGRHELAEDPFTVGSRVRIEVLTTRPVAMAILEYVHRKQFGNYPMAAFIDTVLVDARDKFY